MRFIFNKQRFYPFLFFLSISGLLVFSWFRYGFIYGGGDVGLQTYDPSRILEVARYIWWDATAPGSPVPQGLSAIPLQLILSMLQALGFSPVALQATLFFVLLFLMGFGMYLFLKQKLEKKAAIYPILGGLFYILNPYMMIQVWHRFIHTTIILAAVFPFFAIFWDRWIKEGSLKSLVFFLLTNLLAIYIYGTYAFIITVWIFLILITISNLIPWQSKKSFTKIGIRFLFGFIIWILMNCWWLIPVTKISPAVLSEQHKSTESVMTLINISAQAILPYSLQLINPFYPFYQAEFGASYKSPFLQIMPWIFVVVIMIGFMHSFKTRQFALYGIFYLISIFLAKGVAPPFGFLYFFGFQNIFALGVLRNPFEKTGLILVFFATVLFVLGIQRIKNKAVIAVVLISVLIFSWPMWEGKIIGVIDKPAYVKVPEDYILADRWLQEQKTLGILDGNILHLPLTRGESVQYNWEFGYNGLDPSVIFFTSYPSISRGFNIQRVDDSLTALSLVFYKPYDEDDKKILQLLRAFNVRFIVLHKDLNWLGSDVYDPMEAEKVLNKLNFINKKIEYGDLVVYQVADQFFGPKIEISNDISLVYPRNADMKVWPWLLNNGNRSFISPAQGQILDKNIRSQSQETLIFPDNSFTYPEASESGSEEQVRQLKFKESDLISRVQYFKQLGIIDSRTEKLDQVTELSSNKLIEMYQVDVSSNLPPLISEYTVLIDSLLSQLDNSSLISIEEFRASINNILKLHETLLSLIPKKFPGVEKNQIIELQDKLRQKLKEEKMLPYFKAENFTEIGQRQYFDFNTDSEGKYEVILSDSQIKNNYINKLAKIDFQINGQYETLDGEESNNSVSFGLVSLRQGLNEISLANPPSVNLVPSFDSLVKYGDVKLSGNQIHLPSGPANPSAIEGSLGETTGNDIYQVSFKAQLQPGTSFHLQIIQDSDPADQGNKTPRISIQGSGNQSADWQEYKLQLPALSAVTREAKFRLVAAGGPMLIRDLRIIRVLNNSIFLRGGGSNETVIGSGQAVVFTKISSVQFEGNVDLQRAGFLFFKETYHPGWKLQITKGDQIMYPKDHYLGNLYGNAWYIEEAGRYKFKIFFEPENSFYQGLMLSVIGILSLCIYQVIARKKKNEKEL